MIHRGFIPHDGNNAPQWPYTLNMASPLAKGLFVWYPGVNNPARLWDLGPQRQHHGTLNSAPVWTRSPLGQAGFDYTGADPDHADVGTLGSYGSRMGEGCWASFWCRTTETVVTTVFGTQGGGNINRWAMRINSSSNSGWMDILITDNDTGPNNFLSGVVQSDTGINDGELHHVCGWAHGPSDSTRIWLDGIEQTVVQTSTDTPTTFVDFGASMLIGAFNNNGSAIQGFTGEIYDATLGLGTLTGGQARAFFDPETRWDLRLAPHRNHLFIPVVVGPPVGSLMQLGVGR